MGASIIVSTELSKGQYFEDQAGTALTTAFVEQDFGFCAASIALFNDATGKYIEWSVDGTNVHGRLKDTDDQPRVILFKNVNSIYLRGESGGESYRLEVY